VKSADYSAQTTPPVQNARRSWTPPFQVAAADHAGGPAHPQIRAAKSARTSYHQGPRRTAMNPPLP
jgi:hypothetical protein